MAYVASIEIKKIKQVTERMIKHKFEVFEILKNLG